jgi:hypothetical protein
MISHTQALIERKLPSLIFVLAKLTDTLKRLCDVVYKASYKAAAVIAFPTRCIN